MNNPLELPRISRKGFLGVAAASLGLAFLNNANAPRSEAQTSEQPATSPIRLGFVLAGKGWVTWEAKNDLPAINPAGIGYEKKVAETKVIQNGLASETFSLTQSYYPDLSSERVGLITAYAFNPDSRAAAISTAVVNAQTGEWSVRGGEFVPNAAKPKEGRLQITSSGLPTGAAKENPEKNCIFVKDAEGNVKLVRKFLGILQKEADGAYIIDCDANGKPIEGKAWSKISDQQEASLKAISTVRQAFVPITGDPGSK